MVSWKRRFLWAGWGACFALGIAAAGLFVHGVVRDTRPFEPTIGLDVSRAGDWASAPFRVWGRSTYALLLSAVNHDPAPVGRPLRAAFEVQVVDPDGDAVLHRTYAAGETGLRVPDDYGDARLATLDLDGWPVRAWSLRVRVLQPDPDFATGRTELRLYEQRYDPGMGGLISYAMIVPAGVLLVLALGLSVALARGGSRLPLAASAAAALVLLSFLA